MPHECDRCLRSITFSSESREIQCAGCGTILCGNCNGGNSAVCPDCLNWVKEKYSVPEMFFKKNYLKKQLKEPEPKKDLEALLEETDTDFTLRNIPPGQIPRMESTWC